MNKPRAQRHILGNLGLVAGSLVVGLLLIELGLRIWSVTWLLQWPNFVLYARTVHNEREGQRFVDDRELGYVPRPGYASAPPSGTVSFDAEGLRRNGDAAAARPGKPIVATGDSYTYGDEVGDGETWPARLQALTGVRVLNGGASGYGFDQSVLRAERIARRDPPSAIVVSFIADDLRRAEMRRIWGAEKPYFDIETGAAGNRLVLRNVPVPPRPDPWSTLNFWQKAFGWSYLMQFSVEHFGFEWFDNSIRVHPAGTGLEIACLLTGRLAELQRSSGARVLVMAQYDPYIWRDKAFEATQRGLTVGVLDCAAKNGLATLDTFDALAASTGPGGPLGLYGQWHLNQAGNTLTAELVARALGYTSPNAR